jgi:hypothetical protein
VTPGAVRILGMNHIRLSRFGWGRTEREIGNLTIDPTHVADGTGIPIGLLVVDLTRVGDSDDNDVEDISMEEEEEEEEEGVT